MIQTAGLTAELSRRVELASPLSEEDCLHQFHIRLASSRDFGGKVDANTVLIQRLQDTGMMARTDLPRVGHLELRLTVEAYGAGARLMGQADWRTFAKVVIALWFVLTALAATQSAFVLAAALFAHSVASALNAAWIGMVFPVGMAIYLAHRFRREKRILVEFVTQATKARPVPSEQRRRTIPIVE